MILMVRKLAGKMILATKLCQTQNLELSVP